MNINSKCNECKHTCKYYFAIKIEDFKCKKFKKKESSSCQGKNYVQGADE